MSAPAHLLHPSMSPHAEGWTVPILMPVHDSGKNRGKPMGWCNLNNLRGGVGGSIRRWRIGKAWRLAAYNALLRCGVPAGLGRVYVLVEFRFDTRRHRDPSNYELTVKACLDALQPLKKYNRTNAKTKRLELVIEPGVGVIPGDDPRYLVRGPEMPIGEPLGTKSPIKGMVILHIYPLPAGNLP